MMKPTICEYSGLPCDLLAKEEAVERLVEAADYAVGTMEQVRKPGDGLWDVLNALKEAVKPFKEE